MDNGHSSDFIESDGAVRETLRELNQGDYDLLLISGDIARGNNLSGYLTPIAEEIARQVCFVAGNHACYFRSLDLAANELAKWSHA
jgi:calcineurin-like phosphoesterase family protein